MYKHLTQEQRYYIYVECQKGSTQKSIAEAIGVNESTVCRELRRNGGKNGSYNFLKAQQKSDAREPSPSRQQCRQRHAQVEGPGAADKGTMVPKADSGPTKAGRTRYLP